MARKEHCRSRSQGSRCRRSRAPRPCHGPAPGDRIEPSGCAPGRGSEQHRESQEREGEEHPFGAHSFPICGPTKSHAERTVPLTASLTVSLRAHLGECGDSDLNALVFENAKGHPIRYANFRREIWMPALRSARVPKIGLHVLRHSAAAAMIRAGASPKALQIILGHQSAGFTLSVRSRFRAGHDRARRTVGRTGPRAVPSDRSGRTGEGRPTRSPHRSLARNANAAAGEEAVPRPSPRTLRLVDAKPQSRHAARLGLGRTGSIRRSRGRTRIDWLNR